MSLTRDNFSKPTKDNLAKRVGYICSNLNCRKPTIGAHENELKSTLIGIAAHIHAAAPGGPRYDENMTSKERSHIDNGIWLCSNCATLIDKDQEKYSSKVLHKWKNEAEEESRQKMNGEYGRMRQVRPKIEVDILRKHGRRWNIGYSNKNPLGEQDGITYYDISDKPIIHWSLTWRFTLKIYNNSSQPAFNLNIESFGDVHFEFLEPLPKVNNLAPLDRIELSVKYQDKIESTYKEADEIIRPKFPMKFEDLMIRVRYCDEEGNNFSNVVLFENGSVVNKPE